MSARERFMTKVAEDAETGCWLWTAATTDGYGSFWLAGRQQAAHRVAYEMFVGLIPDGMTIDHVQERGCVTGIA